MKEKDSRWEEDNEPSVYLHNFVTKIGENGSGALFLRFAEEYAIGEGKNALGLIQPWITIHLHSIMKLKAIVRLEHV